MLKSKKVLAFIICIASSLSLTSCETEMLSDRVNTTVQNMLPNLYVTITQLAIFLATAIVFILLAYKPIKKKLQERANYIEKNIKDSEDKNKEASDKIKQANSVILASQQKASEIIQQAQITAENKTAMMEKDLSTRIENERMQAHKDILAEKEKMLKEAHEEICQAAITTSKEILQREVSIKDNDKFVSDFVKQLNEKNKD